jgi:hypothetical protein
MSYQAPNETMLQPIVPAMPQAKSGKGRRLLGVGLILGGLLGAAALLVGQQGTYKNRIDSLERAVSGYSTELTFEKAGTFTLYYEYEGDVSADIDGDDETVELNADADPSNFDVTLLDDNGDDIRLGRLDSDLSYDSGGHVGVGYRDVEIDDPGDYVMEVTAEDPDQVFAIALGIGTAQKPSPLLPVALALAGILGGLAMLLTGRSKKTTSTPQAPSLQAPTMYPGTTSPPTYAPMPPAAPQPPPSYAPFPGSSGTPWSPQAPPTAPPSAPPAPPAPGMWQPPGQPPQQ